MKKDLIVIAVMDMVIDNKGLNLGAMPVEEAKKRARSSMLDLVEVAPQARPPVCKIMDFGKFKYEQGVKEKKQKSSQKSVQSKEIRLSPRIAEHDRQVKTNAARRFLKDGHKVNLRLEYKRRENAHKDLGFMVIKEVIESLSDVAKPQKTPNLDGRVLSCVLEPCALEPKNDKD